MLKANGQKIHLWIDERCRRDRDESIDGHLSTIEIRLACRSTPQALLFEMKDNKVNSTVDLTFSICLPYMLFDLHVSHQQQAREKALEPALANDL